MKKNTPYIFAFIVVAAVLALFLLEKKITKHRLDERITFRKADKIPYGMYVAYQNLKYLFPDATISDNKLEPGYWDSLSTFESKQALVIITLQFYANEFEMKKLIAFAESGNDVFISTPDMSTDAENMLNCKTSLINTSTVPDSAGNITDTLTVSLYKPPFTDNSIYGYPGIKYSSWFYQKDSSTTEFLGGNNYKELNFIHLHAGKGNFYIHLVPIAFSNYFLLHGKNMAYYENALSVISPGVRKIVWDEYFLNKIYNYPDSDDNGSKWLRALFSFSALKAALLTAIFTIILFILMEMRRKQRYIPVMEKPRNDSLDFVRTVGRLYYDKGDHKNLCRKMGAYFLEHVRNRYKLATGTLDEDFIKSLQFKTGCSEQDVRGIVSFIKYLDDAPAITDSELTDFHKQLESFYKIA